MAIQTFSFKNMHLRITSAKWHPFCLSLNVLCITRLHCVRSTVVTQLNTWRHGIQCYICYVHLGVYIPDFLQRLEWQGFCWSKFVTGYFDLMCVEAIWNSYQCIQKLSWSLEMFRTFRILIRLCPEIWLNKNPRMADCRPVSPFAHKGMDRELSARLQ